MKGKKTREVETRTQETAKLLTNTNENRRQKGGEKKPFMRANKAVLKRNFERGGRKKRTRGTKRPEDGRGINFGPTK